MAKNTKRDWSKGHLDWKIPHKGKFGEWYPIVRVGRTVPYGYKKDENDEDILIPIPDELDALEKGKDFRKAGYSYRQIAAWLAKTTGRTISHTGLKKRYEQETKRRTAAANARRYAEKYKKALEKIKRLEEDRIGGTCTRTIYAEEGLSES